MKISTEIGSLLSRPVKEALDIVKNAGFDCADFSFTVLPKTTLIELSDELDTYRDIRRYADGIGLPFNQAHVTVIIGKPCGLGREAQRVIYLLEELQKLERFAVFLLKVIKLVS